MYRTQIFSSISVKNLIMIILSLADKMKVVHSFQRQVVSITYDDRFHDKKNYDAKMILQAFDKLYVFHLKENNHFLFGSNTPMYVAKSNPDSLGPKIVYDRIKYPAPEEKLKDFHDLDNRVAVTVYADDKNVKHINGIIGDCISIRSITQDERKILLNKKIKLEINSHEVLKKNNCTDSERAWTEEKWNFVHGNAEKDDLQKIKTVSSKKTNFDVVYPEILVVVHYKIYEAHNNNLEKLAAYMAAFWNGVDLRFREMSNPKIRLNIAGLVVNKNKKAQSYYSSFRKSKDGKSILNEKKVLKDVGQHFCDTKSETTNVLGPKNHKCYGDVVVFIIPNTLFTLKDTPTNGLAFIGKACSGYYSTAIITDRGGFNGILTAAHELGHLFGALHDGEDTSEIDGGPCPAEDGYMMSYTYGSENVQHWSHCSITAMQKFLRSDDAKCLRNKPNVGEPYAKQLPGKLLTRDQQCDVIHPGFKGADHDCNALNCINNEQNNDEISSDESPAEGTSCGDDLLCLNGICVENDEVFHYF